MRGLLPLVVVALAATGAFAIWKRYPSLSLALLIASAAYMLWNTLKMARVRNALANLDPADAERQARLLVTHLLRDLTRIQVSYLSQGFKSSKEARAWLNRVVPRAYRSNLGQLFADLEEARAGGSPDRLKLALQIRALGPELERLDGALKEARSEHPEHVVASPVVFVITEEIGQGENGGSEPIVTTLASFDPTQPTLVPEVELLTVFFESDGKRTIRGQAPFDQAKQALGTHMVRISDDVYATVAYDAPEKVPLSGARPPLGFVIAATEFL